MQADDTDIDGPVPKPRAITVLGLFVAVSGMVSYLIAYAFTDALVKAEYFTPWQPGKDPRPMRFLIGFGSLMGFFTSLLALFRFMSARHLRRIERMEED